MKHSLSLAAALSLSLTTIASAQTWTEQGNAGHFPTANPEAQIPIGNGQLTRIDGGFTSANPLNDRDMYLIRIDDPTAFSALTAAGGLDTQLFLFDIDGFGVSFHDDINLGGGDLRSRLSGQFVPTAGLYYIAISVYDRDPTSSTGAIWQDTNFDLERQPDGPGAANPIDGWQGLAAGGANTPYSIFLTGCSLPTPHGARQPGSVLIYPVHRSGPNWFTILSVTNTKLDPAFPGNLGGSTNIHYEYVNVTPNPADPFHPLSCTIFDRIEFLTPADTVSVLTTCHNAFAPGGQEGYVVVSAEDPTQAPGYAWDHDYLIGSELVLSATGIAFGVTPWTFAALQANPANAPGELFFDNVHYTAIPETLYVDGLIGLVESSLAVINLTGPPSSLNTLNIQVWNDNERALSTTRRFSCWFDQRLSLVSTLFTHAFLQGTANDPDELDISCDQVGDLEVAWAIFDSVAVQYPSGQPLDTDGAFLAAVTTGLYNGIGGGRLAWETRATQTNGAFRTP